MTIISLALTYPTKFRAIYQHMQDTINMILAPFGGVSLNNVVKKAFLSDLYNQWMKLLQMDYYTVYGISNLKTIFVHIPKLLIFLHNLTVGLINFICNPTQSLCETKNILILISIILTAHLYVSINCMQYS